MTLKIGWSRTVTQNDSLPHPAAPVRLPIVRIAQKSGSLFSQPTHHAALLPSSMSGRRRPVARYSSTITLRPLPRATRSASPLPRG
jgi:hypothetical protein